MKLEDAESKRKRSGKKRPSSLLSPKFSFSVSKKPKLSAQNDQLKQKAAQTLDNLVFKLVNNSALPDSNVTNEKFRKVIKFCITNAKDLQEYVPMSRRKLVAIQLSTFKEFVDMVKNLLNKTRAWYMKETGARWPFIVVAHD
eukprot:15339660-Ditylum_brightwellii.AAC.1